MTSISVLRSSPTTTAPVNRMMAFDTLVRIVAGPVSANGKIWYQVSSARYGVGWTTQGSLTIEQPPTPSTPTTPVAAKVPARG